MQKRAVIAPFCQNLQNFERNEKGELRSYEDVWGTEFAQFFLKFSIKLSIFRFDHFKSQIHTPSHIAEIGKIVFQPYERYWGITAEIHKNIFQALPLVELFKTARVSLCATPGQRVWSDSMHICLCDSLYIGRYRAPISFLAQKTAQNWFFSNFCKIWKGTREANFGRMRMSGVRSLLSCF